jgi:hypothetical protein
MLHEFAVDPALFDDWQEFRVLYGKFGVPQARMIVEFPKKWRKLVYEASSHLTDMQRKTIEEWLKNKTAFLISSNRNYNIPTDWLRSAETAHAANPFHAIIATSNPRNCPDVILSGTLYEQHPLFHCPRECSMPRNASGFARASGPLLRCSQQIIFVDPFFWKANSEIDRKERWGKSLKSMLSTLNNATMIRFCTNASPKGETLDFRQEELIEKLPPFIPNIIEIEILLLQNKKINDHVINLHNRYILTERGGIKFPWGLDSATSDTKDIVNLMEKDTHETIFSEYSDPEKFGHVIARRFTVVGSAET